MPTAEPSPSAKASMLIRRPVADVFNAITSADVLTKFWLSSTSGPLQAGKRVHWEFMVKGAAVETFVRELERDTRILLEWSDGTTVEWTLQSRPDGTTRLAVENAGFKGELDEVLETALESTQGFTIVLCDLKTLLEQGASANLVRDKARLIQEQLAATS
jgi:uncharacterized protein YndB with AHSA1/START domain